MSDEPDAPRTGGGDGVLPDYLAERLEYESARIRFRLRDHPEAIRLLNDFGRQMREVVKRSNLLQEELLQELGYDTSRGVSAALMAFVAENYGWFPDQLGPLTDRQICELLWQAQHRRRKDSEAGADSPPAETQQSEGEQTPVEPDGPSGVDRFWYCGVGVQFGRASKQRDLVLALWDTENSKPTPPRPVEDVITEVYGDDNDTNDCAWRQLCSDTRRRLQAANCPLEIRHGQGQVQLTPIPPA